MTVRREGAVVRLEDDCPVEEAETLVALLLAGGVRAADLSACRHLHAAVLQALLAFGVAVEGAPADGFLRDIVIPATSAAAADRATGIE
jgi:hypothetical protein